MIDWATLVAAGVGGLFGVGASIGAVELERRRHTVQRQHELLTQASGDLLRSMQRYMREILTLAFADGPPYTREVIDGVEHIFPGTAERLSAQETFDQVISDWNGALHRLLMVAPKDLVELSRELDAELDAELDRLLDLAIDERWSRERFRDERREAGRLAAQFVMASRRATGAEEIAIENVWTWAKGDTGSSNT